jgi:hypothetical protein
LNNRRVSPHQIKPRIIPHSPNHAGTISKKKNTPEPTCASGSGDGVPSGRRGGGGGFRAVKIVRRRRWSPQQKMGRMPRHPKRKKRRRGCRSRRRPTGREAATSTGEADATASTGLKQGGGAFSIAGHAASPDASPPAAPCKRHLFSRNLTPSFLSSSLTQRAADDRRTM